MGIALNRQQAHTVDVGNNEQRWIVLHRNILLLEDCLEQAHYGHLHGGVRVPIHIEQFGTLYPACCQLQLESSLDILPIVVHHLQACDYMWVELWRVGTRTRQEGLPVPLLRRVSPSPETL